MEVGTRRRTAAALFVTFLPALSTFAVVTASGIAGGGFKPTTWRLSTLALLSFALAALIVRDQISFGRRDWLTLGGFAALASWGFLSSLWSFRPSISVLESERTVLYLAAAATVLLALEQTSILQVVVGAVTGITTVSIVGLVVHFTWHARSPVEGTLLYQPLGYANAVGIYAVIGILLAAGLALSMDGLVARTAALAPLVVLVPTLALTSSRGAWVALPVGAVVMLHVGRFVRLRILAVLLVGGIILGLVAGSNRGQGVTLVGPNRPHYWHVALQQYEAKPLTGYGAGTFGDYFWRYHRPREGFARDAHSLYLETLSELGPLGLAFLGTALLVPLARLRRAQEPIVAAVGGAYAAFLLHAGVDWDWKVPALTVVGVFCGMATLVATRGPGVRPVSSRARKAVAAGCLVVAAAAVFRLATGPTLGY